MKSKLLLRRDRWTVQESTDDNIDNNRHIFEDKYELDEFLGIEKTLQRWKISQKSIKVEFPILIVFGHVTQISHDRKLQYSIFSFEMLHLAYIRHPLSIVRQ